MVRVPLSKVKVYISSPKKEASYTPSISAASVSVAKARDAGASAKDATMHRHSRMLRIAFFFIFVSP